MNKDKKEAVVNDVETPNKDSFRFRMNMYAYAVNRKRKEEKAHA